MNENDGSTGRGFDPDTAPDLSKGRWPEKFAKAPVRRRRHGNRCPCSTRPDTDIPMVSGEAPPKKELSPPVPPGPSSAPS